MFTDEKGLAVNVSVQPCIAGFESVRRFWESKLGMCAAKILPGEYYVTLQDEVIVTVLGSCISACIRDTRLNIGGMNHFMLPQQKMDKDDVNSQSARYGNVAMEHLINALIKQGGSKRFMEVKLVGGGKIINNMSDVGGNNIDFIHDYVRTEGLTVVSQDLGDVYPRKVQYFPKTGRLRVKKLQKVHNNSIATMEEQYLDAIKQKPVSGDIELF